MAEAVLEWSVLFSDFFQTVIHKTDAEVKNNRPVFATSEKKNSKIRKMNFIANFLFTYNRLFISIFWYNWGV